MRTLSKASRFATFHHANPHVYDLFVALCREWRASGHSAWSISGVFEVARWRHHFETEGEKPFKLANDLKPYYARMIIQEPDLTDIFTTRRLRSR